MGAGLALMRMPGMLQKMGNFSSRVPPRMVIVVNVKFICLQKWPLSIANRGSKLAKFREKSGPQDETGNVAENDHFSSRISFEMRPRQKCRNSQDHPKIPGMALVIPFVSKNGPFWLLIAAQIGPDVGEIRIAGDIQLQFSPD